MSEEALKVILNEAESVQKGIDRSYGAIYTSFGIIMPGLLGVLAFAAKDLKFDDKQMPIVALAFVIALSLGGLWAQSTWMELLRYVRYKYVELMPRLFAAGGMAEEPNYIQWSGPRSFRMALPIFLFNISCWVVLVLVFIAFLRKASGFEQAIAIAFIVAAMISSGAALAEGYKIEREIATKWKGRTAS
jgi:hypothetical protein